MLLQAKRLCKSAQNPVVYLKKPSMEAPVHFLAPKHAHSPNRNAPHGGMLICWNHTWYSW